MYRSLSFNAFGCDPDVNASYLHRDRLTDSNEARVFPPQCHPTNTHQVQVVPLLHPSFSLTFGERQRDPNISRRSRESSTTPALSP